MVRTVEVARDLARWARAAVATVRVVSAAAGMEEAREKARAESGLAMGTAVVVLVAVLQVIQLARDEIPSKPGLGFARG